MSQPSASLPARIVKSLSTMLIQWWDSEYIPPTADGNPPPPPTDKVDMKRVMPFVLLHAGCLLVLLVGFSWFAFWAAVFLYFVRMFAITAFYHRYFSHRTFKTSRFMQMVFAIWGNTSMQRGPLWWASHHRHHHKHSDEEPDVHSPTLRGFLYSHIGWITSARNYFTDYSRVKDFQKSPEIIWINRHDLVVPVLYGVTLWVVGSLLGAYVPSLGTSGAQLFVWGFFVSTVVLLHGTFFINSLAHVFGRRRFKTTDTSRNSFLLAIITLGEGWHNNHHRYMHSARQGFYWWEIDVSYYILRTFAALGLIWDLNPVPAHIYREAVETKGQVI